MYKYSSKKLKGVRKLLLRRLVLASSAEGDNKGSFGQTFLVFTVFKHLGCCSDLSHFIQKTDQYG